MDLKFLRHNYPGSNEGNESSSAENLEQFEYLVNFIDLLFWTSPADNFFPAFLNKYWTVYTGLTEVELHRHGFKALIHENDFAYFIELLKTAHHTSEGFETRCNIKKYDGSYKSNTVKYVPVQKDNKVAKWIGTAFEIAEIENKDKNTTDLAEGHKRSPTESYVVEASIVEIDTVRTDNLLFDVNSALTLEEICKKSQMLDLLLENMSICLFRIDGKGIIQEALLPKEKQMYTDHIRVGKSIFDFYPEWIDMVKSAQAGQNQITTTFKQSETSQWYHENFLFPDHGNQVIGFIIDVTEKVLSNTQIQESEEKFRRLIASAPDAMVLVNEAGYIELVNTQTEKIFGYEAAELIGQRIEVLIPDRFASVHASHRSQFKASPNLRSMGSGLQLFGKRKDCSEFAVEVSLSPIKTRHGVLVSASIRDVSARKEVEIELQKARIAAENANNIKSRFLANMSHEIRTPLNAIIGFSNVLQSDNMSNELRKEYLNHISTSGNLLLKLIGDILDLRKIEEGKADLTNEVFIIREVITSAILPYKYRANEKGLELVLDYDDEIPQSVYGDQYKIKQLIINLIGNAIKFTKEGMIAVSVHRQLTEKNTDGFVDLVFSVSDTGIGVPLEKQQSVFESFTQADNSIAREYGGSGLGLSIVRETVKLMGGSVFIASPSNKWGIGGPGTTISFSLLLQIGAPSLKEVNSKEEELDLQRFANGVRILVVEDNLVNQKLARVLLDKPGCELDFANNGKEAIDKLLNKRYSLILMDVQMPIMDGYEATMFIRANIDSTIPIVGLTANVLAEDIERYTQAGMDDFLGKPYGQAQLYKVVNKWLRN